jgi:hypothetical protein
VTERKAEGQVRSLGESVLFYVGIPAATLYPLGFLGVGIQLWRDPLFPYSRLDSVWVAVSLVPETVVIETGIRLLFLALVSTAFGVGVSVLVIRALVLLGRQPGEASEVGKEGPRRWMLYLLLLMPLAVVVLWNSVRITTGAELAYFIGFLVFSAGVGLVLGYARWRSDQEQFITTVVAAYVAAIIAAFFLAASQTPQLPLVEIQADRSAPRQCSEVPAEEMFVMLDRADEFLYLYNNEGLLSLPNQDAETLLFRECQGYLDRD